MDELKTVLEVIGRMSGDAAGLGTWWIVLHYGVEALGIIAAAVAVPTCVFFIVRSILRHSNAYDLVREIADILEFRNFYLDDSSFRRSLIDKIRELKR